MEKHIKKDMEIFEAMVKIETERNKGQPIPLRRLINLTFSTERCHVVGDIKNDVQLGKFLYENNFLSTEDAEAVQARIASGKPANDLLTVLGVEHREATGGMLTASGCYMEFDGDENEVYVPGGMVYFERSGAPVVLEIFKGGAAAVLDLPPLTLEKFGDSLAAAGAKEPEECNYHCVDCLIPAAKEWIDAAEDIQAVSAFARELDHMERHGEIVKYKAMLEVMECDDLGIALRLAGDIGAYKLAPEYSAPEDYARAYIGKLQAGADKIDLSGFVNLHALGMKVMEHENAMWKSYGVLTRKVGGPILSHTKQPGMEMEMK
jgi:hypothetical protein